MDPSLTRLNTFENYSQFLETRTSSVASRKKLAKNQDQNEFANDMCDANDINFLVKQRFFQTQYPSDLTTANIFCPLCGKLVAESDKHSTYESHSYKRRFMSHDNCLSSESHRLLNDCFDQVEDLVYSPGEKPEKNKEIIIGDRQFCLELTLSHPLSDFKFIRLVAKCQLNGNTLRWELKKQEDSATYEPNIICFPFLDFKLTLIISQIGSQEDKRIFTNYINLSRTKLSTCKFLVAKSENLTLEFNIYNSAKEKQDVISAMNYKYRYPQRLNLPIVELQSISVQIPEEEYEEDEYFQNSNYTILNLLSENGQKSSIASSVNLYSNLDKKSGFFDEHSNNKANNQTLSQTESKFNDKGSIAEKEKVDFQKLISSNKLSSYVRNGAQSRIFQKFLDEATSQQIQIVIRTLYDEFLELILDDYANYMTQKLFQVSSPNQRLLILNKLFPSLPGLVRNKQGTHTIQAFIETLTLPEQIRLIVESVKGEFEQLCFNPISTHFIQKLVKTFPIELTIGFYEVANNNFLKFATDKNAMCVLKYMLRRIKQCEDMPILSEIKKHFINSITLNTHKIIQDGYGNYVVQFCYELFGETKSSGITQMIIEKFVQFSLQRYSSSVVCKCINLYWTNKSYVSKLKDTLTNQNILQMYRNKDGNKILLELMDKNQTTLLREKIYNFLASTGQATKFFHQRWELQKGIKSGPVGFQKSFREADSYQRDQNQSGGSKKKKK